MKLTYADTGMIKDTGKKIIELSNEYNLVITNFFKKLSNFPYNTNEWTGKNAELYSEYVSLDKQQYVDFAETIKSFGNKIIDSANSIETCIKACNNEEEYRES